MKNRTTSQTTGPKGLPKKEDYKNAVKLNKNTAPIVQNPATMSNQLTSIMKSAIREAAQENMQRYYNNIPFKNNAIDILNRRRYDISSEFDGQEVQGTMTERPTFGGGMVETERYNMPGGGSRMERTRFNAEGQPVKRVIRDNKINPR